MVAAKRVAVVDEVWRSVSSSSHQSMSSSTFATMRCCSASPKISAFRIDPHFDHLVACKIWFRFYFDPFDEFAGTFTRLFCTKKWPEIAFSLYVGTPLHYRAGASVSGYDGE